MWARSRAVVIPVSYFCNRYHMQQSCEQQQPPIVSLHITWALRPTIFVLLTFLTFYIKHATDVFLREVAFLADSPLFLLELRCCSLLISRRKERGSKTSTTTIQRPPFSGFDWLRACLYCVQLFYWLSSCHKVKGWFCFVFCLKYLLTFFIYFRDFL